jgi:hypothetical protein
VAVKQAGKFPERTSTQRGRVCESHKHVKSNSAAHNLGRGRVRDVEIVKRLLPRASNGDGELGSMRQNIDRGVAKCDIHALVGEEKRSSELAGATELSNAGEVQCATRTRLIHRVPVQEWLRGSTHILTIRFIPPVLESETLELNIKNLEGKPASWDSESVSKLDFCLKIENEI